MPAVPLFLVEKNAALALDESMPGLVARRLPLESVAGACDLYRRIAICQLLESGVPDGFFEHLALAGQCLLHWLEGVADEVKVGSRAGAFLDAIACGADALATRIAERSADRFRPGEEYEEDFLFLRFLMAQFRLHAPRPDVVALVERFEQLADGADPRAPLCRALLDRDQRGFDAALPEVVAQREAELAERRDAGVLREDESATIGKVHVELLAVLRLAAEAGLVVEPDHPRAPSCARRLDRARLPAPGAWSQLPSYWQLG